MKNGGGHFAPKLGGQYDWNLQLVAKNSYRKRS